jgi:hypothetical protein
MGELVDDYLGILSAEFFFPPDSAPRPKCFGQQSPR